MEDTLATESDAVAGFEAALGKSFGEAPPPENEAPPTELEVPEELELKETPPEESEEEEKPKTYKVKADGKEIEVTEDELLKGYSRDVDYRQKTMALAAERKQAQEAVQQVQQERQQYQAQLNQLASVLGDQLQQQPNWEELLQNDPVEYLKQQHLFNQRQAAYQNARQEQARYAQQTQEQQAIALQEVLKQEQAQLLETLPSWKDPAKAQAEKAAIAKHLAERGYTQEQIAQLADHKTVVMAREAMLYRQMMAKAKETTKAVEKLPPRMEKPGISRPSDGRTADMQALKKSGKAEDAAALFAKMF